MAVRVRPAHPRTARPLRDESAEVVSVSILRLSVQGRSGRCRIHRCSAAPFGRCIESESHADRCTTSIRAAERRCRSPAATTSAVLVECATAAVQLLSAPPRPSTAATFVTYRRRRHIGHARITRRPTRTVRGGAAKSRRADHGAQLHAHDSHLDQRTARQSHAHAAEDAGTDAAAGFARAELTEHRHGRIISSFDRCRIFMHDVSHQFAAVSSSSSPRPCCARSLCIEFCLAK